MRKPGSLIILALLLLITLPLTSAPVHDGDGIHENPADLRYDFPVTVTGTRAAIRNESVTFTSGGVTVSGRLYFEAIQGSRPAVVFGVGYTAQVTELFESSNYGWISEHLASSGYVVLVVRYAAPSPYEDPMEFLNLTRDYSLWVNQTRDAVTALRSGSLQGATYSTDTIVDPARIALAGHSIGGAVSIVSAARDRRIKCVVVMSPQNYAGTPRMNDYISQLSPSPVQLQVGELDLFGGVATVLDSYNGASEPKQMVSYRYGTYEGFTDLGRFENIDVDDLPSGIADLLKPIISTNPLSTKQHDLSRSYTTAFLDHYLKNDAGSFDFKNDHSEGYLITNPPLPPVEVPDVWHATTQHQGLDVIFQSASCDPSHLDFKHGTSISVRTRITPKGIWETGVTADLTFPDGSTESHAMTYRDAYDIEAGFFSAELRDVSPSHSLGTVHVTITATDAGGDTHTYTELTFELTTSSLSPTVDTIAHSPETILPVKKVTFTLTASDPEGDTIAYYHMDFGDGNTSGWVSSNRIDHTYGSSGQYIIRARAKDDKAAESAEKMLLRVISNPPTAKLTVNSAVNKGQALELDGSRSLDPDGDALEYFFSYGDGIESGWSSSPKGSHRYDTVGEVTVTLKVRDQWGVESPEVSATVRVREQKSSSPLSGITSSSGFPIMIIVLILIIIIGAIVLLRDEDDDGTKPGKDPHRSGPEPGREGPAPPRETRKPPSPDGEAGARYGRSPDSLTRKGSRSPQDRKTSALRRTPTGEKQRVPGGAEPHDPGAGTTIASQDSNTGQEPEIDAPPITPFLPHPGIPPGGPEFQPPPTPAPLAGMQPGSQPPPPPVPLAGMQPGFQPPSPPAPLAGMRSGSQPPTFPDPSHHSHTEGQPSSDIPFPPVRTEPGTTPTPATPTAGSVIEPGSIHSPSSPSSPPSPSSTPGTSGWPGEIDAMPIAHPAPHTDPGTDEESWDDLDDTSGDASDASDDNWDDDDDEDFAIPVAMKERMRGSG